MAVRTFWNLLKDGVNPTILASLCPDGVNPPKDVVQLKKDAQGTMETFEDIQEEDDLVYDLDNDYEGKTKVRKGRIVDRPACKSFPMKAASADRVLDLIQRRIIRQQRLRDVVLRKVQSRIPGYEAPFTDPETVGFYLRQWKETSSGSSPSPHTQNSPQAPKAPPQAQSGPSLVVSDDEDTFVDSIDKEVAKTTQEIDEDLPPIDKEGSGTTLEDIEEASEEDSGAD